MNVRGGLLRKMRKLRKILKIVENILPSCKMSCESKELCKENRGHQPPRNVFGLFFSGSGRVNHTRFSISHLIFQSGSIIFCLCMINSLSGTFLGINRLSAHQIRLLPDSAIRLGRGNFMARLGSAPSSSPNRPMPTVLNINPSMSSPLSRSRQRRGGDGISICGFCTICTCVHLEFLKRPPGIFKIAESLLGLLCQFLLVQFGSSYAPDLGDSYTEFLVSVSSCLLTTVLLLVCYILSKNSYHLIRSSIFETGFNIVAAFLYMSSAAYLAFATNTKLYHRLSHFTLLSSISSITAAYTLGFVAGIVHAMDAYQSYKSSSGLC